MKSFLMTLNVSVESYFCISYLKLQRSSVPFPPPDLSLQDSLLQEYKLLLSSTSPSASSPSPVSAVRIAHSGRNGRFAVIYLQTMSDVARAISATANATTNGDSGGGILGGTSAEAHVYLSEDMIEE